MKVRHLLLITASALSAALLCAARASGQSPAPPTVTRIAELTIAPAQIEAYKAALKEEVSASLRLEPGVLRLLAVSVKGHPEQVRLFETYRDAAAYQSHLKSAHFLRYKAATEGMVTSLRLIETDPILLGTR